MVISVSSDRVAVAELPAAPHPAKTKIVNINTAVMTRKLRVVIRAPWSDEWEYHHGSQALPYKPDISMNWLIIQRAFIFTSLSEEK
jgi:hypothetical protein